MSFRVIRVSSNYRLVVLVSPEDAGPEDECEIFVHNNVACKQKKVVFKKSTRRIAICYFSGQADGLGFGEMPNAPFGSLREAADWTKERQEQCDKEALQEAESFLKEN